MDIRGWWKKDEEGYMEFESSQIQRLYELVTDQYYNVYNRLLDEWDDEEAASQVAREAGFNMITDYKEIDGASEFATSYSTPTYVMDIWYEQDPISNKRIYEKGFLKISSK